MFLKVVIYKVRTVDQEHESTSIMRFLRVAPFLSPASRIPDKDGGTKRFYDRPQRFVLQSYRQLPYIMDSFRLSALVVMLVLP